MAWRDIDHLQVTLIVNLIAIFFATTTAILLAWNNAGSKNMPLAVAALIGVTVGYLIQLPFELARSTTHETIGLELTIDRAEPVIRQWVYGDRQSGWRLIAEVQASNWLAQTNPMAFGQPETRDKTAIDLVIYSLVSCLTHEEYD